MAGWLDQLVVSCNEVGRHPGLGIMTESEEVLGYGLVFGAGWGKTEPSNDPLGSDRDQQIEPFVPSQAVAPANVVLTRQPTSAPTLSISNRDFSTV